MRRFLVKCTTVAMLVTVLTFPFAAPAFADTTPTTGQPGASSGVACGTGNATMTPGGSGNSPGAPFNGGLPGQADKVYAGNPGTASLLNSNSSAAVSQYDVACLQVSQHP